MLSELQLRQLTDNSELNIVVGKTNTHETKNKCSKCKGINGVGLCVLLGPALTQAGPERGWFMPSLKV